MADYAPNVTPRYRLHYNAAGRPHTIMCRVSRGTSFAGTEAVGISMFFGLFTALATLMCDDLAFVSSEIALTDSDLFFPASIPGPVVGTSPIAQYSKMDTISHWTFSGRGDLGSKVSMKVYGIQNVSDVLPANAHSDFVLLGSEDARVANAVLALNSAPLVTVDNTQAQFANRVTIKVNDFWLRQVRKGL